MAGSFTCGTQYFYQSNARCHTMVVGVIEVGREIAISSVHGLTSLSIGGIQKLGTESTFTSKRYFPKLSSSDFGRSRLMPWLGSVFTVVGAIKTMKHGKSASFSAATPCR